MAAPARRVLVLNGPNLGRLGTREPEVYGSTTHADLVELCRAEGTSLGLDVEVRQTDSEAELVGWLHEAADAARWSRCTSPTRTPVRSSGTRLWCPVWRPVWSRASAWTPTGSPSAPSSPLSRLSCPVEWALVSC
jgi:hypothetical protein